MTLAELRTLLDAHMAEDLDGYDGLTPSDGQKDDVINWGVRMVGLSLYLFGDVAFTPTEGDRDFSLCNKNSFSKEILTPDHVVLDDVPLRDATRRIGLWSYDQFTRWFPQVRTASNGTPTAASFTAGRIVFDKPFDASAAAATGNYVVGRFLPEDLSGDGSEPTDIPTHLHETIVYLAAIKWSLPNATVDEQYNRLRSYSSESVPLLIAEFTRQYRDTHGRDPSADMLRQSCAVYKATEKAKPDGTV